MLLRRLLLLTACGFAWAALAAPQARKDLCFRIKVVDDRTGRGVPLVELATVNHLRCVTDSNGVIAFHEPALMGHEVFFFVSSHGYEFPKDGFGYRGVALKAEEGGNAEIKIHRINIAERLYRITGEGIYADSLLVGEKTPLSHPLLDGGVLGQDGAKTVIYHGKVQWIWGDTTRASYPLGDFNAPGAISRLPEDGGLDPEIGVDLDYFNVGQDGFVQGSAPIPGDGPSWMWGLVVLKDKAGREHLFATYAKVRQPMDIYDIGLAEFDDATRRYRKILSFGKGAAVTLGGRTFLREDGHAYFGNPVPLARAPADPDGIRDPRTYEAFTCLKPGSRLDRPEVDRGPDGAPRWSWRKDAPPLRAQDEAALLKSGLLKPGEGLHQLRDVETGAEVTAHAGSVCWNPWRRRWVMIVCQVHGSSPLGEIWYAEADTPLGPWVYARKIATHDRYSFYNPTQHPEFDKEGGRLLFFEGTYTAMFSGNPDPTPRYDYNQVMYKLDLGDARLALPVPVYKLEGGKLAPGVPTGSAELPPIAFFALDRERPGAVKVPGTACWGLPADAKDPPPGTMPWPGPDGKPACLVWKNPLGIRLPAP